jgi:hypothetical protein
MYNQQANVDRINSINSEIANLEMKRTQAMMPQPITQNFQMLNNNSVMRFANNIEEVQRDFVITDTPFFSKDMSVLWIKNTKGDIKAYELNEIIEKDEKDIKIEMLQAQLEELKRERVIKNEPSNEYVNEPIKNEKSTNIQSISRNKKNK